MGQDDVADLPSQTLQATNDPKKTYFLIGPAIDEKQPEGGYNLLVVLPGGDGSESFLPFIKSICKNALPDSYIVAQLVEADVADVAGRHKINTNYVFTLSWSSSGPATYETSLQKKTAITGSYIAMSVFNERTLPPISGAKGRTYYIEHSPEDKTCPFRMARRAAQQLTKAEGPHGWRANPYERIRNAILWLQENTKTDIEQSVQADE